MSRFMRFTAVRMVCVRMASLWFTSLHLGGMATAASGTGLTQNGAANN